MEATVETIDCARELAEKAVVYHTAFLLWKVNPSIAVWVEAIVNMFARETGRDHV